MLRKIHNCGSIYKTTLASLLVVRWPLSGVYVTNKVTHDRRHISLFVLKTPERYEFSSNDTIPISKFSSKFAQ